MNPTNERIQALRGAMKANGFDAVILPSNDPHQSEYVSDYWKIRAHFSGFTGSAGTLVVSQAEAAIWTDSRYFLQANQQCEGTAVNLHKQSIPHAPEHIPWVCKTLNDGAIIALDYRQFSVSQMEDLETHAASKSIQIKDLGNLIDQVWENRPLGPANAIVNHAIEHCGASRVSKINQVQQELLADEADFNFISSLDEICWLFNIRSTDVDFTPLVTAYALVGRSSTYLFVHENRIDSAFEAQLDDDIITVLSYDDVSSKLEELTDGKKVIASPATLNYACASSILGEIISKPSLVQHLKSIKNEIEIENAKSGMVKDGIALTQFLMWMEDYLQSNTISEYELGRKLESFRAKQALYKDQSFGCIVGYKSNGAIIHYSAPENGSSTISADGILLVDSGAQYENATTDITRTVWLGGVPSAEIKKAYTLVLKGYIELETIQFPRGTTGIQLDAFARMHLWKHGLNYGHGTGHGVGSYSMVHEPAQGFTPNMVTFRGVTRHDEHQFTSIEPGYYQEGGFGIRIENIVVSKVVNTTVHGDFLGFEAITICPIDTALIDRSLMLDHEIDWLNAYHEKVYNSLAEQLNNEEQAWLKSKCARI
jgi:Xaa-Pro aminopeptidase